MNQNVLKNLKKVWHTLKKMFTLIISNCFKILKIKQTSVNIAESIQVKVDLILI